jgi:hypothetical protein
MLVVIYQSNNPVMSLINLNSLSNITNDLNILVLPIIFASSTLSTIRSMLLAVISQVVANSVLSWSSISISSLRYIGQQLQIQTSFGVGDVNLPQLEYVGTSFLVTPARTTSIRLPLCRSIGGSLTLSSFTLLKDVDMPLLQNVANITITNNVQLLKVSMPLLSSVASSITIMVDIVVTQPFVVCHSQ